MKNWWGSESKLKPEGLNYEDTPYNLRFKKSTTQWVLFVIVVAVVALVFGSAIATNPGREVKYFSDGKILNPPSLSALTVGCMGVMELPPPPAGTVGVVPKPVADVSETFPYWFSFPPVSGNFYHPPYTPPAEGVPFLADVESGATPNLGEAVALLYRGWIVVWYKAGVVQEVEVESFRNSIEISDTLRGKTIIAPWPYENDVNWDGDKPWVYTAWGAWEKCDEPSLSALEDFQEETAGKAPNSGLSLNSEPVAAEKRNNDFPDSRVRNSGNF